MSSSVPSIDALQRVRQQPAPADDRQRQYDVRRTANSSLRAIGINLSSGSASPYGPPGLGRSDQVVQQRFDPLDLGGELTSNPGRMSALSTRPTRGETSATTSTAA